MSNFNNKSITNKGLELLSAAMAGGKLEFTRIVMGSGTYSGDIGVIKSLVNQKQSLDIKSITKKGSQVILSTTLLQSAITEDFYWKEIGVYAKGNDGVEVLYMYGSATDTSFISKDMLNEKMINVGVLVSNAQNITATIDGSLVYLSRADLEEHNSDETAHKPLRSWVQGLFDSLKLTWDSITGKPETFPPSEHNHDDRYYTESEIDSKLNDKANTSHTHTKSQITDFPTSLPASDVYSWAKQPSKPSYSAGEVGAIPISASCNKNWNWAGQGGQPSWLWGSNDGANMYVYNPSNFRVANANTLKDRDICAEVDSLKSTVVNGKQEVVNAINDKLGYVSGLTTSHPFGDYGWWIRNKVTSATINYDTAIAALKLYETYKGYLMIDSGATTIVPEDGYVFIWDRTASTWTATSGSMVRFPAGETHDKSTYCYKVTAGTVIKNGMINGQAIYIATHSVIRSLIGLTIR